MSIIDDVLKSGELEEVVRRYARHLYARLKLPPEGVNGVDDTVQEALISIFRQKHLFRGDARWTTWAYTHVRGICVQRVREQAKDNDFLVDFEDGKPDDDLPYVFEDVKTHGPDQLVMTKQIFRELLIAIDECLSRYDGNTKIAVMKCGVEPHFDDGWTLQEGAEFLEIAIASMQARVVRFRECIKAKANARGFALH